ncbi:CoA-substrate-specific enzyme activase, putative [Desulfitobacterium dichloroeliminans LMG P-21439]|uniref:CoA-substrate-specific enzyme activase, putative n=1 Tax=Desulfitobacterium dichloroeliminans (strain LMG P-21439 / DCA1) TaxID=871963 RepID=L0FCG1_DESDL|nr:acyl-CoA dehydratase activase [Desulfitobacterium dichloroeliminans]AGA70700.1 CoA-substrate-specific enzyme activase, putative [Desulfitobacterium dichloroeliminans LMG P-21439]
MKRFFIGIDSGSTTCKSVLMSEGRIIDALVIRTGWNPQASAEESMGILKGRNDLDSAELSIAATGYGREAIDFADHTITEITCHALGGVHLMPDIQGIIDIGGQDSKVIQIHKGKPINFLMNDKCAAGTGRFLKMACDILEVPMDKIDDFTDRNEAVSINSMCTVFAESEIIGLLAMQKDRAQIMAGVLQSIARKIQQQAGRIEFAADKSILMTGGLSRSGLIIETIAQFIGYEVKSCDYALYAGAIGACVFAAKKENGCGG